MNNPDVLHSDENPNDSSHADEKADNRLHLERPARPRRLAGLLRDVDVVLAVVVAGGCRRLSAHTP